LDYGLTYLDMQRIIETLDTIDQIASFREFKYEGRYLDRVTEARLVVLLHLIRSQHCEAFDRRPLQILSSERILASA